jgi:hypothetical protein
LTKIKRGTGKMEFFSNFDYIKSKYYDGYVVAKELHELIKKEKEITMSYKQFCIYFKEFIFKKDERFFSTGVKKDNIIPAKEIENSIISNPKVEPQKIKKIISGETNKKKFNPHTVEINEDDII